MEERESKEKQQQQHIASPGIDGGGGQSIVVTDFGVAGDASTTMGANRSGSTSSTAELAGEYVVSGGGSGDATTSTSKNPPPRQSSQSKRDSGYHTDCSPATFSTGVPHFTFDPTDPRLNVSAGGSLTSSDVHQMSQGRDDSSAGYLPRSAAASSGSGPREGPFGETRTSPAPSMGRGYTLSPGWQPHRVLPEVSDDEDDDAFVSESVVLAAGRSALQSRLTARMSRVGVSPRHGRVSPDPEADVITRSASPRLDHVTEEADDRDDKHTSDTTTSAASTTTPRRRSRHFSSSSHPSPARNVSHQRGVDMFDDGDDEAFAEDGVANTDYIHGPLTTMTLPSGDRIRPLIARTIATQTPHLHCQLIDQILGCPQGVPTCARGSAVRRLRYYSEGEETVPGTSYLSHGPLPDLVPVTHVTRERSLSAPDLETLQRQRMAAREVGRELRRISDEFLLTYNHARPENRDGALAALHAELNGVAAFFLTGVRRFVYRNFAGYFRHVFNWTRRVMNSAENPLDSSADNQR